MRVVTSFHMWQRINVAAYMVWIAVLAITLLWSRAPAGPTDGQGAAPATAMAAWNEKRRLTLSGANLRILLQSGRDRRGPDL